MKKVMMKKFNKEKQIFLKRAIQNILLGLAFCFGGSFSMAYAADASLYLLPDTGVYSVGDEFPVSIHIDTDGETITAVGGSVRFNSEQLEIVSISTGESIVSSWIPQEGPTYSLDTGVISFEGFISGGYQGDRGKIAEVTFRALQNVTSQVRFQGGSAILAADERATNILTQMNSGAYTLTPEEISPQLEYVAQEDTEPSVITSSTHPEEDEWYQSTTTEFSWEITESTRAVRLLLDTNPTSIPTIYYADPISERTIEDLGEGVWYFHLQKQNDSGWGDVAHHRVQIDTTDPEYLDVVVQERLDPTDPQPVLEMNAFDALSGIRGFEVQIDDDAAGIIVEQQGTSTPTTYKLQMLAPGEHTIAVRAIDYAGNDIEETINISVAALSQPTITSAPQELTTEGLLVVKGESIPNSRVRVFISNDGSQWSERSVLSNADGSFTYVMEQSPEEGTYYIKLQAQNSVGAESAETDPIEVVVTKPGFALYGGIVLSYLTIIVPLVGLLVLLVVFMWYGLMKVRTFRRRLSKEVTEAEETYQREFAQLQKITETEIRALERARLQRRLTPEEESILQKLRSEVQDAYTAVEEEFDDIKDVTQGRDSREDFHKKVEGHIEKKKNGNKPRVQSSGNKMQLKVQKLQ